MRTRAFFLLVVSLMSIMAFAQGEDPGLRKDIEAFYHKTDGLINRGNWEGFLATMAPDAVMADTQGKRMNKAEIREWFMQMKAMMPGLKIKSVVKHARDMGNNEAVAWVELKLNWKQQNGRRWSPMKLTVRVAESLRRTENGWRTYYSQELPLDAPWSFNTGG